MSYTFSIEHSSIFILNFLFVEQENPELSVGISEQVYIQHALSYVFLKHALARLNL